MHKLALALLVTASPFFAQDLPKADTILDRFVEVVGGKSTFEKHHNEVMHGTMDFVGRGVKGTLTVYQQEPDQIRATIELEGIGKIDSGTSGDIAWENSAMQGPRIKKGVEKSDAFRDATFNAVLKWRDLYSKAETTGEENVNGHECYKVVLTPREGNPTTHFYDKKSGLMVKTATTRTTQMGDIAAEVFADDYRKEGDILTAHKLTNKFAGQEFQITVQSVEYNVDIAKDRFEMPDEIKALAKKSTAAPAVQPAPAAAAASGGNTGKLTLYMTGKAISTENYSVQKADGKIEVSGSANAAIGPIKIDIEQYKVVTDEKFQPLSAVAKGKLGQVQMNVNTIFADGKAKNEMDSGQGPQSKVDPVSPGALVVSANFPLYPWSLLALRADLKSKDPQQIPIYILGQSEVPGTVVFKGREPVEFAGKTAELNHINISGTPPDGQPITLDFWVDDNRKVIKIAVPSRGVEAYQEGFERKAPPEAPKPESKP
ncbi:MAG TPA: DUF620 domain-containing protein [Bryobacteraceae bacterium]|nr:DUF620 domain-containing protein [Bryobacteraceae bacterium]